MTIPTLITACKKRVVETRLEKFYSTMTQAIRLAENENDEIEGWYPECQGKSDEECLKNWFRTYFGPHIKYYDATSPKGNYVVSFPDGSGFYFYQRSETLGDIHFMYCVELKHCEAESYDGQNSFLFTLSYDHNPKFMASLPAYYEKNREFLLDSCSKGNYGDASKSLKGRRHACARLIEIDGWKIKSDYPWKQTIIGN